MRSELHEWETGWDLYLTGSLCVSKGMRADGTFFYVLAVLRRGHEIATLPLTLDQAKAIGGERFPEGQD